MTKPPAPYASVRVVTTLITSLIWCAILFVTTGFAKKAHAAPLVMANVTALSFMFVPYFATHSVLMGMSNRVLKGAMVLPESIPGAGTGSGTDNPWRLSVINSFIFGLVPGAIGYFIAINAGAESVTPRQFGIRYALAGSLIAATVTFVASGRPFLRLMGTPKEKRAFAGTPDQYLMRYFALPHGIANFIINGALAFALSPVPFAQEGALVPTRNIVVDTLIAFVILTLLIASGAKSQARVETLLGIAPPAAASKSSYPTAFFTGILAGVAFTVAVGVVFWLTKSQGLDVYSWAVYRAVVFGVYAGWLTKGVARAVINTTLQPETAATPADRQAA